MDLRVDRSPITFPHMDTAQLAASVSNWVQHEASDRAVTLPALAARSGVPYGHLMRPRTLTLSDFDRICRTFGVPVADALAEAIAQSP